ncbi:Pimeloyl-ACP methyl ester carboxylesterase [Quadrisphaera granulorum]|uniref:Pimeloyl-ACP methyl ester carboxylesterase n=1 Tax=Quadrisphaera granulorum TaxID=317664 RepID=A0A315ZNI7_9ACTN|nr:alpha/beta hydrolase [Quadrisphaera granulorum]PWJ46902.1 pimeloyl-ACP methyl ester carboxylesterase [Quadrisphaera granulorum]SZE98994.1 Pimeloyl-ACP methyl ester carboxylesterase [Quadrisphaera granulorum]
MTQTPTIVLLGGSGLGPWAWGRLTPVLNEHGIQTVTPQLRGTGDDPTPASALSLDDWIDDAARSIGEHAAPDAVLVAHSFAGYVAAGLLERNPTAVRATVFLDAVLPSPRRSWFDAAGPGVEAFMLGLAEDGAIPFFTREQLDQVHPRHGLSNSDWTWMQPRLSPQPLRTYTHPAITRPLDPRRTRLAYVRCLHTTPSPAEVSADTPGWTVRTLPTGHWPMITDPHATAGVLRELIAP